MEEKRITFVLRVIQNQIKMIIHNSRPKCEKGPKSQLQAGILGYLYHYQEQPVYQRDLEKEFRISGATATNTLQVMEREGLIVRKAQDRDARLKRIQMTEEALQGHARMEAHMEMMENCITGGMTEEEVRQLFRLLGMVMKNLEGLAAEYDVLPQEDRPEKQTGTAAGGNSPQEQTGTAAGRCSPEKQSGTAAGRDSPERQEGTASDGGSPEGCTEPGRGKYPHDKNECNERKCENHAKNIGSTD